MEQVQNGEIIIVGDQVSSGYLNARSVDLNNFFQWEDERAYHTGDYSFIKDGYFYFTGRYDNQVKLNGYRIELDYITRAISKLDYIDSAITLGLNRENIIKKIISIIIINPSLKNDLTFSKKMVLNQIREEVPHYMLPSDIKTIKEFPLNMNNKINKKN